MGSTDVWHSILSFSVCMFMSFSFHTANIVTLEEIFKKWGNFFVVRAWCVFNFCAIVLIIKVNASASENNTVANGLHPSQPLILLLSRNDTPRSMRSGVLVNVNPSTLIVTSSPWFSSISALRWIHDIPRAVSAWNGRSYPPAHW